MPTYRNITTTLVSQFDILIIPEYEPPKTPTDPFLNAPTLIDYDHSLVSVYVPTYPSSQFWLQYSISPPHPPRMLYYFKLYLNGSHVVSWGCGNDEGYEGKTMFGLFDPGPSPFNHSQIQRRAFCFGSDLVHGYAHGSDNLNDALEIRVFRSKGRRRINPQIQEYQNGDRIKSSMPSSGNSVKSVIFSSYHYESSAKICYSLVNAGLLPEEHPRRYYKYALLDPLDQPFATFRYLYRSWGESCPSRSHAGTKLIRTRSARNTRRHLTHPKYRLVVNTDPSCRRASSFTQEQQQHHRVICLRP